MSDAHLSSIECLAPGLYIQRLTVARRAALADLLTTLQRFIAQRTTHEPLYLLLDASSLDIAYTPRVRERLEEMISQIHQHQKTIRIALLLPQTMGTCTVFLNKMLRSRETNRIRHTCFSRSQEAISWLQHLQSSESLPAAQGF